MINFSELREHRVMNRLKFWLMVIVPFAFALPSSAQDEPISEITITANIRTYVLDAPRADAELHRIIAAGAEETAYGRDQKFRWLRILDGWVPAKAFNLEVEIYALPDLTHSFQALPNRAVLLHAGPSSKLFEAVGQAGLGASVLITGRNKAGTWLHTPGGWLDAAQVYSAGAVFRLPVIAPPTAFITAKTRTFVLAEPYISAELVEIFETGEEALPIGWTGAWLQTAQGWVLADSFNVMGEIKSLPYVGLGAVTGIDIRLNRDREARNIPSPAYSVITARLKSGETAVAVGRNEIGNWLLLESGWIVVGPPSNHSYYFRSSDDVMRLPVIDPDSS